jgi:hypothetical protein
MTFEGFEYFLSASVNKAKNGKLLTMIEVEFNSTQLGKVVQKYTVYCLSFKAGKISGHEDSGEYIRGP